MIRATAQTTLLTLLLASLAAGCHDDKKHDAPLEAWTYQSKRFGYRVKMPGDWKREQSATLNQHADLAASKDAMFFLIVIPQRLRQIEGVEPPDALALKRAGLDIMSSSIDGLALDRQGPVRVDGHRGYTVFAHGRVDKQKVAYVTTYVTESTWGYQIVAWAPEPRKKALIANVDEILANWKFTTPAKPGDVSSIERPGSADDASTSEN